MNFQFFKFSKPIFLLKIIFVISIFLLVNQNAKLNIQAANVSCGASPNLISTTQQTTISLTWNDPAFANRSYTFVVKRPGFVVISEPITTDANGNFSKAVGPFDTNAVYTFEFWRPSIMECSSTFTVQATTGAGACPQFKNYTPSTIYENSNITAYFDPVTGSEPLRNRADSFLVKIDDSGTKQLSGGTDSWQANIGTLKKGTHIVKLYFAPNTIPPTTDFCYQLPAFTVQEGKEPGSLGSGQNPCPGGICETALGKISSDPAEFAKRILEIAIGLAGGIALIIMVIGSIRVLTSSGDQQKLSAGRDMIVAAVAGLLFLIFSVLILKFIGVEILKIPGFG